MAEEQMQTIRVYIPVDVVLPKEHVEMVMEQGWKDVFYDFASMKELGLYVARLMLFSFLDEALPFTRDLTEFDGHCVLEHKGQFKLRLPDDEAWTVDEMEEWLEEIKN